MTAHTHDATDPAKRGRSALVGLVCLAVVASAAAAVWLEFKRTERVDAAIAALGSLDGRQRATLDALAAGDRDLRYTEAALLGANVVVVLAALIGLARPRRMVAAGEDITSLREALAEDAVPDRSLPLGPSGPEAGTDPSRLRALVALCDSTARAESFAQLSAVLADAASAVFAKGIVIWAAPIGAGDLRAALAYGYPADLVARLKPLPRTADNATANACRTGRVQVVKAKEGDATGAVVAPLMSARGCVGCLAVEMPRGTETTDGARTAIELLASAIAGRFGETAALGGALSAAPEVRSA